MILERVYLIGLSGSGKTTLAPLLAERLGFEAVDIDAEVERHFGRSIPDIFAAFGEPVFRAAERDALAQASRRTRVVVATGGGAVLDPANWASMRPRSAIVHLTAAPSVLIERLEAAVRATPMAERPLLRGDDPLARLESLWQARRHLYEQADLTIDTTGKSLDALAQEIAGQITALDRAGVIPVDSLGTPSGRSDLYAAPGLLAEVGTLARRRWPKARRAWVIADEHVLPLWGAPVEGSFTQAGFDVTMRAVPAGEGSKSFQEASALLDWLLGGGIERGDVVVALGGGVVGDLAGFVAAIVLRGVGLVQLPTSLLAMVDSSVGGKTGVNHTLGKNLIGAFYQPPLVVADPHVLRTLPPRDLRNGWAEIVKHSMIECTATATPEPVLLPWLEGRTPVGGLGEPGELAALIAHNIRLKAAVVRADEREAGLRRILNYGHTLGHAIEAAGYRYLHGEAVALGMRAAARLAHRLGLCDADLVARQDALLDRLDLPRTYDGEWEPVREHLLRDKKVVQGTLTWILPEGPGRVVVRRDVPLEAVEAVAREIGAR
ncbi:3-dehydroquinate synthase [Sphaerobacter thermophilus]|uniref:Multifunctional fusion protein n=1 Tax=Sphaerobacter thermophilus (strain ATCC 49802 / DSM 20745 / KCCM 41009 / NCIMB 13125 / S 6022) TaxID=479434 RepID=D1C2T5_SPHTD|nr:3-dehydroquinate synthase [Sphaerobacter thermophilus]ACZ38552.1 3-dehydroquinate synthase [Sphaerobacter thermophilus DSM 20745]